MKRLGVLLIISFCLVLDISSTQGNRIPNEYDFIGDDLIRVKRDYYYDDWDEYEPAPYPTSSPPPSFSGFQTFIDGLNSLMTALNDPDYDWNQRNQHSSLAPESYSSSPGYDTSEHPMSAEDLRELSVLIKVLQILSDPIPPSPTSQLQKAQEILEKVSMAFSDHQSLDERIAILETIQREDQPSPDGEPKEKTLDDAINEVSQLFQQISGGVDGMPPADLGSPDGPLLLLNSTIELLETANANFQEQTRIHESADEETPMKLFRLNEVINHLKTLSELNVRPPTTTTTTTSTTTHKPDEDPCVSPFLDIAYKICVLPVFDQKLTWDDAQNYCRSRGLKLAIDPAVIKGRKYLHRTLGVDGTRERFPIWIGAKLEESEKRWLFTDGVKVPNFFWSKGNPRTYNPNTTPAGACVYLDGFREYYAASLPCHYKRRFICQKW